MEPVPVSSEQERDWPRDCTIFSSGRMKLLGVVPWQADLLAPRTADIAAYLEAEVLSEGQLHQRRVQRLTVCARTIPNMVDTLRPGTLMVTPGDREDIVVAVAMAAVSGIPLAGLLLTGGLMPDDRTIRLCRAALESGLPVLRTDRNTYHTAHLLALCFRA